VLRSGLLACAILLGGCASEVYRDTAVPMRTVASVDLGRYAGRWYEIARFPNWFEEGCVGTTADYAPRSDGGVDVVNSCRKESLDGPVETARAVARASDASNARLKVKFSPLMPVGGDYWIIYLDPEYRLAVVGTPGGRTGWILARRPQVPAVELEPALAALRANGYDTERLVWVDQPPG